jgi:glutamate-ammonia-ligase adenylyltransferase
MDKLPDPRWQDALQHSRYLSNLLAANPTLMPDLAAAWTAPLSEAQLREAMEPPAGDDETLKTQLRRLRQRAMAHIALRDLCGLAPLAEVVESMTLLADFTTNLALDHHHRHGQAGRTRAQRLLRHRPDLRLPRGRRHRRDGKRSSPTTSSSPGSAAS